MDCYGTLVEIGYALGEGKRVHMVFSPDVTANDFWHTTAHPQVTALQLVAKEAIKDVFDLVIAGQQNKRVT